MTKEDFRALSSQDKIKFLSEGGEIDSGQKPVNDSGVSIILPESTRESLSTPLASVLPLGGDRVHIFQNASHSDNDAHQSGNLNTQGSELKSISQFDGFMITDPVELLFMFDRQIKNGEVELYDWQIKCLTDFALGGESDIWPFQAVVQACNGSGKDIYVIAASIVWIAMRYKYTTGVITSASGTQLDRQTCRYIKFLTTAINSQYKKLFGFEPFIINYRHYQCRFPDETDALCEDTKSEIFCYATDEAGKAEGYHPTIAGAKMAIMVSEDKTVADDINVALNKCTGYTHRVHASTPGIQLGHFYDYCNLAIDRKSINSIRDVTPTDWIKYKVTAYDCRHLVRTNYIDQMKRDLPGGESGSAFRSQVLSEFGTTDEMVVIPYTYIWRAVHKSPQHIKSEFNDAGLDLSDGGAETVFIPRNGNKVLAVIPFKFDDTEDTIEYLVQLFKEWHLDNPHSTINGDCTGIGSPILKNLRRRGWKNIRFIDSRAAARRPKVYKNRATELFFNLRFFLERTELILVNDPLLMKQLGSRYYKITSANVHQLLSKIEQKSKGYPSPDRADALNLAFWNYESSYVEDESEEPYEEQEEKRIITGDFLLKSWANGTQKKWKANEGIPKKNFSSLEEEVEQYNNRLKLKSNV